MTQGNFLKKNEIIVGLSYISMIQWTMTQRQEKTSALTYQGNLLKEYRNYTYDSLGQTDRKKKISSIQQNQGKIYAYYNTS